jgi:tetratricopeptide (TPR) repeat protein
MGQLGLSYALGELGDSVGGRAASRRAMELAAAVTPRERFRVELRSKQLAAADTPGDAAAVAAYRAHLERVDTEFSTDVELLLVVGQTSGHSGPGMHGDSASLRHYERARAVAPDYFAIDHYTAHAYENIGRPKEALSYAQRFATNAANVPHAHHMFGHVLRQVDRMSDAIAEFEKADALHTAATNADGIPADLDWHYRHNLDLLATSYQYVGKMTQASTLLKRSFEIQSVGRLGQDQDVHKRTWPLFLLSRGRSQDALDAARAMQRQANPLVQALGHVMASRALQALDKPEDAAAEGNAALTQMRALGTPGGTLVPDFELAQGEYLLRAGNAEAGGKMLRSAVTKLMADRSPDAWIATVFQLEAAVRVARERGQVALATDLSGLLRQHAPYYAGTHYALGLLAEQRGDKAGARTAYGEAAARWRDADRDLLELMDVARRLSRLGGGAPAAADAPR